MYIFSEPKVIHFAEGDAQPSQRTLDPPPLADMPTVGSETPQKVQHRMCGQELAAMRLYHERVELIVAGIAQGVLDHLLCCTRLCSAACGGGSLLHECIRTAVGYGDIGQQKPVLEDSEDINPVTSRCVKRRNGSECAIRI